MFVATEILDLAVKLEENGEKVYRRAVAQAPDSELASLLAWMADEERQHAKWFADLKQRVSGGGANPFMEEMSRELFADLVGNQSFSLRDVDFAAVGTVAEMIAVFIEFERDTLTFFKVLRPFVDDDETRACLEKVIDEEHRHIERLTSLLPREEALSEAPE